MKIGTIGSGVIVDRMMDAISNTEGAEATAVYSRTKQRADEFADKYQIKKRYTDLDDMFRDPEVDTIYIASPNSLHYAQAKKALQAGKNAIVEKPFAGTRAEAEELFELAEQNGVHVWEAITNQYLPNFEKLKETVQTIGEITGVMACYCQYSSKYQAFKDGKNPNVFNPAFDGGALQDINVYNIHLVTGIFGKPESVHYFPRKAKNGIDTGGTLILDYGSFVATLVGAKDSSAPNRACFLGDKATVLVEGGPGVMPKLKLENPKGDLIGKKDMDSGTDITQFQKPNHMDYEMEAFLVMDEEGYRKAKEQTLLVCDILESAKEQRDRK